MADSTLNTIRKKVRRLTRTPSVQQLSDIELDQYINTFILYDFPAHIKVRTLRKTFTFFTEPNVDTYKTNTTDINSPLFNFKNRYITTHEPVYVAGYEAAVYQSREQFFLTYPMRNSIQGIGQQGDGITQAFAGTLSNLPVLRNNVLFSSVDAMNNGLALYDDGLGILTGDGTGTINYETGAYTLNFSTPPAASEPIRSQTVPYVAARPYAILFFEDAMTLRPVPDQVYRVQMEVNVQPAELLSGSDSPDLAQWWQYIAYGAAKKVFEDRMDLESVQMIMPEFKTQERLVLRRSIVQQTKERVSTIYTDQVGLWGGWNNNNGYY